MKMNYFHIIKRSLTYGRARVLFQVMIIILLAGVITGSLMTGKSVRTSLKKSSQLQLGNTGIVITSGLRYFDPSLAGRIREKSGVSSAGLLEIDGYCQKFSSGETVYGVKIYAIDDEFFAFHNISSINLNNDYVAVNEKLAERLNLLPGDEIIIRFSEINDIPADAPFAPDNESPGSLVMKTGNVLKPDQAGNFSLGISQITPLNIFVRRSDLTTGTGNIPKINRLLISEGPDVSKTDIYSDLADILRPSDIGLNIRNSAATGGIELVSDRIFIDQLILDQVREKIPASFPVITYLANRLENNTGDFTPYSFVAALPDELYADVPAGEGVVINRWLSDDISAREGDTIFVSYFSPDASNRLTEDSTAVIVSMVTDMEGIWSDSLLMPEFPGIAGTSSCTQWDAGIMIDMDLIRPEDEEYWNNFKGVPKAFINYDLGLRLWGNNFGPATAIRFPEGTGSDEIETLLTGAFDPYRSGFQIADLQKEVIKAASESVDFSSLFISLGFFIILSSIILLSLVISSWFESKMTEVKTLYSLGFSNSKIEKLLLLESALVALAGLIPGIFAGEIFNIIIINSLNSVWQGAVQTSTLNQHFDIASLVSGFFISAVVIFIILLLKVKRFLRTIRRKKENMTGSEQHFKDPVYVIIPAAISVLLLILSFYVKEMATMFSFSGGALLFITFILFSGYLYLRNRKAGIERSPDENFVSDSYYSHNVSHATTPTIFLAAGIFAIVITGINRMNISTNVLEPGSGTGGFLLWAGTELPFKEDLNDKSVRFDYGLDESKFDDAKFVRIWKSAGNDASCLNLNYIAAPPILGIDPAGFSMKGSFSAASVIGDIDKSDPWSALNIPPDDNTIYGIADQTVLEWGLKIRTGDTLIIRSENGQPLKIIIAAGLKASVFQGNVIIGLDNFNRYFPSVSGSTNYLIEGDPEMLDDYITTFSDRLSAYGFHAEPAAGRLASFYEVTNTYLQVFTILGGFGVVLGVIGMGFVLLRNYRFRKRDFALLLAVGFAPGKIRKMIRREQIRIILTGVTTGMISGLAATITTISGNQDISFKVILFFIPAVIATGILITFLSVRTITGDALTESLRKE